MDQAITVLDFKRMLIGEESPLFLLEIAVRTAIIYGYTLLLLRWLGSRTVGQLSNVEFLLVIALGSAVGDAMFYPDVPLIHSMLVVTVVVGANKLLDLVIARSAPAERLLDGKPREAIRDGVVVRDFIDRASISRHELFQELREKGIEQLGEVRRAYIEKDGKVTVFKYADTPGPGLPIVPPPQIEPPRLVSPRDAKPGTTLVCVTCGNRHEGSDTCSNCDRTEWTHAAK
jgi:uncharacterized membrane protein YcaP (DUF421 family)